MVYGFIRAWFGEFTKEEAKKFVLLGAMFAFIIGINWLLRTLKDSVFIMTIGGALVPYAKLLSFVIAIPVVAFYGKLIDWFSRYNLFYILCIFFGSGTLLFSFVLQNSSNSIGWMWYLFVETYGSLIVTLFWAFVADITKPESGPRGYGLIALCGQVGNIFGSLLAEQYAEIWGTKILTLLAAIGIFMLIPLMKFFISVVKRKELVGFHGSNEKEMTKIDAQVDFAEGLGLLLTRPYLLSIFAIVCFYEIMYAILYYRFISFAGVMYTGDALTRCFGHFGVLTGVISLLCLLSGIHTIGHRMGLTASLVLSPLCMALLAIINNSSSINMSMWVIVFANVVNFALHQPCKEQLYIPTTHEAKYKTKAWIEIFGFRGAKAVGAGVNMFTAFVQPMFIFLTTFLSLGLASAWLLTALFLGRTHKKAVDKKQVIC